MIRSTPSYRARVLPGIDRTGRTHANSSSDCRKRTLTLRQPPATGVCSGPLMAIRLRRIDSIASSGSGESPWSTAVLPATTGSHSIRPPVTKSTARTIALLTSGPMPSPGRSVTAYFNWACRPRTRSR